jgi:hypothetical protein
MNLMQVMLDFAVTKLALVVLCPSLVTWSSAPLLTIGPQHQQEHVLSCGLHWHCHALGSSSSSSSSLSALQQAIVALLQSCQGMHIPALSVRIVVCSCTSSS